MAFGRLQGMMVGCGILLIVATPLLYLFRHRLAELIVPIFRSGDDFYADKGRKRKAFDLFWISFLGLFFEVLIIRWLSTEFRLFAYFKNLPLVAAFNGLGIGFALVRRRENLLPLALPLITFLCGLILLGARTGISDLIRYPAQEEFIWALSVRTPFPSVVIFFGAIVLPFFLTVVTFVPFGQLTGRLMNKFPPLTSYTINIVGSVFGISAFSAICFLSVPPLHWFVMALLPCLWFLQRRRSVLLSSAVAAGICLGLLLLFEGESLWSSLLQDRC